MNEMEVNERCVASAFSSSASTPSPPSPFQPKFTLHFSNLITKDGDVVTYTIRVVPADGRFEESVIQRQYEDFEWLAHCLTTSVDISGIIVPPLPNKPSITAQVVDAKTKKQFGVSLREVRGDGFHKDFKAMEKYINLLMCHVVFGENDQLINFLTKPQAPARTKIKKGLLTLISSRLDSLKSNHRDCEEFFQKEKDWVSEYGLNIFNFTENLNKLIFVQQRLCASMGQISTDLNTFVSQNGLYNGMERKLMGRLAEGLNDLKQSMEVQNYNDELILVATFEFYTRYVETEKEMLARRTMLLIDYENCNKAMDKAKDDKYDLMQDAKKAAEKSFEDCSDVARREIKAFHRQRVNTMLDTLRVYAQVQLKSACDTYAILANSLNMLEKVEIFKIME